MHCTRRASPEKVRRVEEAGVNERPFFLLGNSTGKMKVTKVVKVSWRPLWASASFYHDAAGIIIGASVWPLLTLCPVGPSWLRVAGATSPISRAFGGPAVSKKLPRCRLCAFSSDRAPITCVDRLHASHYPPSREVRRHIRGLPSRIIKADVAPGAPSVQIPTMTKRRRAATRISASWETRIEMPNAADVRQPAWILCRISKISVLFGWSSRFEKHGIPHAL